MYYALIIRVTFCWGEGCLRGLNILREMVRFMLMHVELVDVEVAVINDN